MQMSPTSPSGSGGDLTERRGILPQGNGNNANSINFDRDSVDSVCQQRISDSNIGGNVKEKQRVSTESSIVSFSSSCSSSVSYSDFNKADQPEASAYDRTNFLESPATLS